MRGSCEEARRVVGEQLSQRLRHAVCKHVLLDSVPHVEHEKPTGLEHPLGLAIRLYAIREEHCAELAADHFVRHRRGVAPERPLGANSHACRLPAGSWHSRAWVDSSRLLRTGRQEPTPPPLLASLRRCHTQSRAPSSEIAHPRASPCPPRSSGRSKERDTGRSFPVWTRQRPYRRLTSGYWVMIAAPGRYRAKPRDWSPSCGCKLGLPSNRPTSRGLRSALCDCATGSDTSR